MTTPRFDVEVRESPSHGFGLFAASFIPKDAVWWRGTPENTLRISRAQYETLRASHYREGGGGLIDTLHTYSYYERALDALILILDDTRYINHHDDPNAGGGMMLQSQALRDIHPGEEIVEDYRQFDPCPWASLYGEFGAWLYGEQAAASGR